MRFLLKFLIVVGLIMDLLCLKYRYFANAFIYLECLTRLAVTFIPNYASYDYDDIGYIMLFTLGFLLFYNDDGKHIICSTLTMAWHMFFAIFVAYNRPYNISSILFNFGAVFLYLILQIALGMIIVHISEIHSILY